MNKKIFNLILLAVVMMVSSCEIDNYDQPEAIIFGRIIDQDGENVQSDVSAQGTKIIYFEKGNFAAPERQAITPRIDGTYERGLIFPGFYDIVVRDANFRNLDTLKNYEIKAGRNELNFTVQPYIKVRDLSIVKNGNLIVAKFKLSTPGSTTTRVASTQLFSYIDKVVSIGTRFATQPTNAGLLALNRIPGADEEFTLQIDLSLQGNLFSKYPTATKFWFRVGAVVVTADATGTPKWNYSEPIQLAIN
ncbi:DUF3823 domain-containing protein [Pedobacter glucosidilyticus]|uniref:DUF3823 domain-containing protein n=1 Tax=Pedobacter glucosidilyticus TaxID=1122941 RepID=UPI0026E99C90|nr:DUF3823 domain-containing protein [Pedobacter glucosidilyticus]